MLMRNKSTRKIVPHSILKKLTVLTRNFMVHVMDNALFSEPFYVVFGVILVLQTTFSALFRCNAVLWSVDSPIYRILRFFEYFWRFGSYNTTIESSNTNFVIILCLYTAGYIPYIVSMYHFNKTGRIETGLCYVISFLHEFFLPIVASWMPSAAATMLSFFMYQNNNSQLLYCVILLAMLVFHIYFNNIFIYSYVAYCGGRSLTWTGTATTQILSLVYLHLFFSRIAELSPKSHFLVFALLFGFVQVIYIALGVIVSPLIKVHYCGFWLGILASSFTSFCLNMFRYYGLEMDSELVFVVFISAVFVFIPLVIWITLYREKQSLSILSMYESGALTFPEAFPIKFAFLRHSRAGFKYGDVYTLSWAPFRDAVDFWPDSELIWRQWLRLLAIYSEENNLLASSMAAMKSREFEGFQTKSFLAQIKSISNGRHRHNTPELSRELKMLDVKIKSAKQVLASYWRSISENSTSDAYDMASAAKKETDEIIAKYRQLVLMYPNNASVCSRLSRFLDQIMFDPKSAYYWRLRADKLKEQKTVMYDKVKSKGLALFPHIPKHLDRNFSDDIRMSESFRQFNSSNSQGMSAGDFETEEIDFDPSSIREIGMSMPLWSIRYIYLLLILVVIIAFLAATFSPTIILVSNFNKFLKQFSSLSSVSDSMMIINKLSYYLLTETMTNASMIFTKQQESTMLGSGIDTMNTTLEIQNNVALLSSSINSLYDSFQESVGFGSSVSEFKQNNLFELIEPIEVNGSIEYNSYNVTLMVALNSLSSNSFLYDPSNQAFFNDLWFLKYISNAHVVIEAVKAFEIVVLSELESTITDSISFASTLTIVFLIVTALIIPAASFSIVQLSSYWTYIIGSIGSLPRVALKKVVSRYEKITDEEQMNYQEQKYLSIFTKLSSTRDQSGGLPTSRILIYFVVSFVLSCVCVFFMAAVLSSNSIKLFIIPHRYQIVLDSATKFLQFNSIMLRAVALSEGIPFWQDTAESISDILNLTSYALSNTINELLFKSVEGINAGIVFNEESRDKLLFDGDQTWVSEASITNLLSKFPGIVFLDIMETISKDIASQNVSTITKTNFQRILVDHMTVMNLIPNLLSTITKECEESAENTTSSQAIILFGLSVGLLIFGIVTILLPVIKTNKVSEAIHFALSSLSMVDINYVYESASVSSILSGNTTGFSSATDSIREYLENISDLASAFIVTTNNSMQLLSMNKTAAKRCGLNELDWKNSHISMVVSFEDQEPIKMANDIFDNKISSHVFKTNVKIHGEEMASLKSIGIFGAVDIKQPIVLFIIFDPPAVDEKRKQIELEKDRIANILVHNIPKELKTHFSLTSDHFQLEQRFVLICAIKMMNYQELSSSMDTENVKNNVATFRNTIRKIASESIDAIPLKSIANITFVAFNMRKQATMVYPITSEALQFCKKVAQTLETTESGFAMALSKKIVYGRLSQQTTNVDLFSSAVPLCYSMGRKSKKGTIYLTQKVVNALPTTISHYVLQSEIVMDGRNQTVKSLLIQNIENEAL